MRRARDKGRWKKASVDELCCELYGLYIAASRTTVTEDRRQDDRLLLSCGSQQYQALKRWATLSPSVDAVMLTITLEPVVQRS